MQSSSSCPTGYVPSPQSHSASLQTAMPEQGQPLSHYVTTCLLSGCGSLMHLSQCSGLLPQKRALSSSTHAHFLSCFCKSQTKQKTISAEQTWILLSQVNNLDRLCKASRHQKQFQEGSRTGLERGGEHKDQVKRAGSWTRS